MAKAQRFSDGSVQLMMNKDEAAQVITVLGHVRRGEHAALAFDALADAGVEYVFTGWVADAHAEPNDPQWNIDIIHDVDMPQ